MTVEAFDVVRSGGMPSASAGSPAAAISPRARMIESADAPY
jgi:hypothetical protein